MAPLQSNSKISKTDQQTPIYLPHCRLPGQQKKHTAKFAVCRLVKLYRGQAPFTAPLWDAGRAAVSQFDQSLYSKDYFYYSY